MNKPVLLRSAVKIADSQNNYCLCGLSFDCIEQKSLLISVNVIHFGKKMKIETIKQIDTIETTN